MTPQLRSGVVGLMLVIGLCGCATTEKKPLAEVVWTVAYSPSKGNAISWRTQKNVAYTLLYRNEYDRKGTSYVPHPRYSYILGTGREIRVHDRPPLREKRRYRVQTTVLRKPQS